MLCSTTNIVYKQSINEKLKSVQYTTLYQKLQKEQDDIDLLL